MPVRTPSYRLHKPSGQAVVTLDGRDHYLGPWPAGRKKPPPEHVRRGTDLSKVQDPCWDPTERVRASPVQPARGRSPLPSP